MINRLSVLLVTLFTLFALGCGNDDGTGTTTDATTYQPFSQDHLANQLLRVAQYGEIATKRKEATLDNAATVYGEIETLYQATSLKEKVAGRVDVHSYGSDTAGAFLDRNIQLAIDLGKAPSTEHDLAYAGQIADKGLLVFFYQSVYYELSARTQKNFDEAFGYYGLSLDGTEATGLAATSAKREPEFEVVLNDTIFNAFLDARQILADTTAEPTEAMGENAEYDAAVATIDAKMLEVFAYGIIHEMDELEEGDAADIKVIEARLFFEALRPYAEQANAAAAQALLDGLYPEGAPSRDEGIYFTAGLEGIREGSVTIAADAIIEATTTILSTL